MNEKKCPKCEVLPELPKDPVKIYIYTEIDFLRSKLIERFQKKSVKFRIEGSIIISDDQDIREFLGLIKSMEFSPPEQEEIKLCYAEEEESIFSIIPRFKPLNYWLSRILHEEYIEILRDNRLTIHFHPIVNLVERRVFGYECLIRGVKKNGELIYPNYLFKAAVETGTLFYLDRSCREKAIKTSAVKGLKEFKVFINFLPTAIYDPNFCLQNTVKWAYQLEWNPNNLVFEVVESEKVQDLNHLSQILDYYREHGFLVALDDVGTGYSSLDALIKLYPDFIKISRELIEGIDQSDLKRDLVDSLVKAARKNNIKVIAEGVERRSEAEILAHLGVELMQGYLFAKPNPEPILEIAF